MIDLHMHVLPGLDDGAQEMEEAVEMAWQAVESGVRAAAATSHLLLKQVIDGTWRMPYERRLEAFRQRLRKEKIGLKVYAGAEILLSREIESLEERILPTLNGSRYPLVEFSFLAPARKIEQRLRKVLSLGYRPILAHPERYRSVQQQLSILHRWQDLGVIFQVNKGSLSGEFGREVFQSADWMLRQQLVGVVASDAHDPCLRTPSLEETADHLSWLIGESGARLLLEENPRRILENREIW